MTKTKKCNTMDNEQAKAILKYSNDPIAFINEEWSGFDVFKIKMGKIKPFEYQEKFIEFIHSNDFTISSKARQMHLSSITCVYVAWYVLFNKDKTVMLLSHNSDSAKRLLSWVKNIVFDFIKKYNLEEELNFKIRDNNTRVLSLFNGCKILSKSPAVDAGKGEQIHFLVIDEAAYIKNLEDIWMGIGICLSAIKNSKCVIISSPNGFEFFYKTWVNSLNGYNNFVAKKFKWDIHPVYSKGKYLDEKTGKYSSPWRDAQIKRLNYDEHLIDCEIDCEFSEEPRKIKKKVLSIRVDQELYNKINKCLSKRRDTLNISDYFRALVEEDYKEL